MAVKTDFDTLDDEALVELFRAHLQVKEEKRDDVLSMLLEQAVFIEGKKGKGKTLLGVGLSYELRERFDCPIVVIGTTMGLKPEFGKFQFMPAMAFRDEMERISIAADEEENAEQVMKSFEKYGVSIIGATIIFDEARKLFNSRNPMNKLIQLTGDFMAQSRHYHVNTFIFAPDRDEIDKRVYRQGDWTGRAYYNKYTRTAHTRLVQGLEVLPLSVDGGSGLEHTPFQEMYDSWAMIGFRKTSLNIKE